MSKELLTFAQLKKLRKSILGLFSREQRSLYWSSIIPLVRKRPIEHLITNDASAYENPAIIFSDQMISYVQLRNAVGACAEHLKKIGIISDERVGILGFNSVEYIVVLLSLWSIKAVPCLLNIRLPELVLNNQLQSINCRHHFSSAKKPGIANVKHSILESIVPVQKIISDPMFKKQNCQKFYFPLEQKATILFTTGSGSSPKPVLHTIGNHIFSAKGSNEFIPVAPGDQWLLSLPLYHVSGLSIIFRVFREGGTIVIPETHESIQKAFERYDITHASLVPAQFARLCADDNAISKLRNLKAILVGGSGIPSFLLQNSLKNKLPVYTTYGLTEMASQVATGKYPMPAKILKYRNIKISNGGEILVKGDTLFLGYIEGDALHCPLTADGWFETGDLGYQTEDGGLVITGRKDNMFISGGENIQPEEIEQWLGQLDSVEQAMVVPVRNDEFGFRPVAFIKIIEGKSLNRADLYGFLEKHLPKFKIPDQFYQWPDHPVSRGFKIKRRHLIQFMLEQSQFIQQIH